MVWKSQVSAGVESLESRRLFCTSVEGFAVTNLVSDGTIPADFVDENLVNAWGLAASPNGPFWVADNGTGVATLYNGEGEPQTLVVTIPPAGDGEQSAPTGEVFNGGSGFAVTADGTSAPALFIFVSEDGGISGWNPTVDATNAVIAVDNSDSEAIYKGAALGSVNGNEYLYATDFHNGKIDVFDSDFQQVTLDGDFVDPKMKRGFAPFGIANINGQIYVTYAKQDEDAEDDVAGQGRGFVDVFNPDGTFVQRLVTRGGLNAPWGLAIAPESFGKFAGELLVGNFGNGKINVYDPETGQHLGKLRDSDGKALVIDGLWSLAVGNDQAAGSSQAVFFTAGPDDETHGLFGMIAPEELDGLNTDSVLY